jgi:crossover junction endodeoxyribonuclease RusA
LRLGDLEPWLTPFPLELVIQGTPIALGGSSSSRNRWKAKVGATARTRLREVSEWEWLDERRVAVTIFYFLNAKMQGDIDNIVKPILDAMTAIVYPDDRSWSACSRSGSNPACSGRSRPIAFKW